MHISNVNNIKIIHEYSLQMFLFTTKASILCY